MMPHQSNDCGVGPEPFGGPQCRDPVPAGGSPREETFFAREANAIAFASSVETQSIASERSVRQSGTTNPAPMPSIPMLETSPGGTGLYLVAWLNPGVSDQSVARAAALRGIDAIPLSTFCTGPVRRGGLVLGYSSYEVSRIRLAVRQLAPVLSTRRRLA
jgi:hypothetical protein